MPRAGNNAGVASVIMSKSVAKTAQDKSLLKKQYIFAIDRTAKATQKKLIEAISKGIGTG